MLTDHYFVLGVPQDAELLTIKKAYRAKAMESHPDRHRGDNPERWHQAMQQINEAFAILSSPEKRRTYDEARANPFNQMTQRNAANNAAQARQGADQYPQDFAEFETWLDTLTRDFTDAEYYHSGSGQLRVDKSVSGGVFMVVGFVGGIAVYILARLLLPDYVAAGPLIWLSGGAGAGIGAWIHKQIGDTMRKPGQQSRSSHTASSMPPGAGTGFQQPNQPNEPDSIIIKCPNCNGQLRLPARQVNARCPRCQHTFFSNPSSGSTGWSQPQEDPSTSTPPASGSAQEKTGHSGIMAAVVVGFVAFIILSFVCTSTSSGFFGEPISDTNWSGIIIGTGICALIGYNVGKKL
jgi:curved DNA-binding protein CbpA